MCVIRLLEAERGNNLFANVRNINWLGKNVIKGMEHRYARGKVNGRK